MKLNERQTKRFEDDGFIVVKDLLNPSEVAELIQHTEQIAAGRLPFPQESLEWEPGTELQDRGMMTLRKINNCAEHDQFFAEHASKAAILDIIEALLGSDIKRFGDQAFIKPPGGSEKTYHQDSAYFAIEPKAIITCWAALDDVTQQNGCLWVIPGSHIGGIVDHSQEWMVGDRKDMMVPDEALEREREVPITMKAGSCSFHHSVLLHRSGPNLTEQHRRGLATHYMSSRSRWVGDPAEKPHYPLLRGREYADCA
jgi:phytanoyl-CoA hydroxylase